MKDQNIKVKAGSLEQLHKITVDLITLSNSFCEKYPEFDAVISISHRDLNVTLQIKRGNHE